MELNWFQSILYGFLSGLMDILPVSARAHNVLLLKVFGVRGNEAFQELLIHLGVFAALYFTNQPQLVRLARARALARIPKRKRKRPLDTRSLMDLSLLKTMLVPVLIGLFLYQYAQKLTGNLVLLSVFLFFNGIILYVPQFLPSGNRDSRTLSRVEGLLMGLGGALSTLPGVSAIGTATSIGSVCGVDRSYALSMALLMNLFVSAGFVFYDILAITVSGLGTLSVLILVRYVLTSLCAFGGTLLGIKIMRYLAANQGYGLFGLYSFGLALFTFILNLMA